MKLRHILAAGTLVALATPALAQSTTVSATTDLNVRAGPGSTYPVVGVIPADGSATLSGCTEAGSWCQVTVDGTQGWAFAEYLTTDVEGETVTIVTRRTEIGVPTVVYEEEDGEGEVAGAATGAVAGAIIGGPVGAAIGGAAGLAAGAIIDPPEERIEYVRSNPVDPIYLEGEAVVGARLPETVELQTIPEYEYNYVYVNGQPVLVDPSNREVVYVVRD